MLLGLVGVLLAGLVACAGEQPPDRPAPRTPAPVDAAPLDSEAVRTLREWDARRARAYAAGDLTALRRLYTPGSRAGAADARMLRGYVDRGLRVEGMRMQLLAVRVRAAGPGVLRLQVTDRLANAVAVGERRRLVLPRDSASRHVVTLRRDHRGRADPGRWRVATVR